MSADFGYTDACEVHVPIMTNFAPIEKNQGLVVHWEGASAAKAAPKPKTTNWYDKQKAAQSKKQRTSST